MHFTIETLGVFFFFIEDRKRTALSLYFDIYKTLKLCYILNSTYTSQMKKTDKLN